MPSSSVPLKYERIARALAADIANGVFPIDEPLPSEAALVQRFSASRNTVRQALAALADQGLIVTRPGVGSFVAFQAVEVEDELGWAQAIQQHGVVNRVRLLGITQAPIESLPAEIRATTRTESSHLWLIERVRQVVGDRVISLERSLVPAVPTLGDLPLRGLRDDSILRTLDDAGLAAAEGEQWVEVGQLAAADAEVFGRPAGDTVLVSRCVTHTSEGTLAEYAVSVMDPGFFRLHLTF